MLKRINMKKINKLNDRLVVWERFLEEDLANDNKTGIRVCERELEKIKNDIFVLRQKSGIIEIEEI